MDSRSIYTIGYAPMLPFGAFLESLRKIGVNCIVDVRYKSDANAYGDYNETILFPRLKEEGIACLSFTPEFGIANHDAYAFTEAKYKKVIATDTFISGVKRLENGVGKGYTIALLGFSGNPTHCHRFTVIGRYLSENGWDVYHITHEGRSHNTINTLIDAKILTHKEMEQALERLVIKRKARYELSHRIGRDGEEIAAGYLMEQGYNILDRNWNLYRGCEIDIVAFKDNTLHAIEVKTRRSEVSDEPERAVNYQKLKNMVKALSDYKYRHGWTSVPSQIDVIAVVIKDGSDYDIRMSENIVRRTTYFY